MDARTRRKHKRLKAAAAAAAKYSTKAGRLLISRSGIEKGVGWEKESLDSTFQRRSEMSEMGFALTYQSRSRMRAHRF